MQVLLVESEYNGFLSFIQFQGDGNMERKFPVSRLLLALWLLSSQTAGAALVFAPFAVLLAFRGSASAGQDMASLNFLLGLGYIMPLVFIGLGIAAWVMFAKRRNAAAGWLGIATLIPGAVMLFVLNMF